MALTSLTYTANSKHKAALYFCDSCTTQKQHTVLIFVLCKTQNLLIYFLTDVWYGMVLRGGFPHALKHNPIEFSTQPPYPRSSGAMHGLPAEEQGFLAITPFCI
jgi:hypothetical protein